MGAARCTSEEAAAEEALALWLRIEASIYALQQLTKEQRARLPPGVLPDVGDLAVLGASLRLEREQGKGPSSFTAGFGLTPKWRSRSKRALRDSLICQVPTKANEPSARAAEIAKALRRHAPAAHGHDHPLTRVIAAHGGKPSFSSIYRAISVTPPVAENSDAA